MALIGRHKVPCLGCGFDAPHVKQNDGKHPYVHCPECGLTVSARNGKQAAGILAGVRPEKHAELPRRPDDISVSPAAPAAAPADAPPAAPAPRKRFATLLG